MKMLLILVPALAIAGSAQAQDGLVPSLPAQAPLVAVPTPPQDPPAEPGTTTPQPPAPPARVTPFGMPFGPASPDPINVQFEIRLREEGPQPSTKVVATAATLGEVSIVRANQGTRNPLNVDVLPNALRDGRVHSRVVIEYTPAMASNSATPLVPLAVRQTVNVWLDDGKPMIISQSADPNSDRRLIVEVTATILK